MGQPNTRDDSAKFPDIWKRIMFKICKPSNTPDDDINPITKSISRENEPKANNHKTDRIGKNHYLTINIQFKNKDRVINAQDGNIFDPNSF